MFSVRVNSEVSSNLTLELWRSVSVLPNPAVCRRKQVVSHAAVTAVTQAFVNITTLDKHPDEIIRKTKAMKYCFILFIIHLILIVTIHVQQSLIYFDFPVLEKSSQLLDVLHNP